MDPSGEIEKLSYRRERLTTVRGCDPSASTTEIRPLRSSAIFELSGNQAIEQPRQIVRAPLPSAFITFQFDRPAPSENAILRPSGDHVIESPSTPRWTRLRSLPSGFIT